MVDVHLIGGFVGAGKTSTVRHLLGLLPAGERVAVLLNDFGDARVDEALIGDRVQVREISGSCVCCTAPEGLVATLGELVASGVDRILVEPTGLARPSDLVDTLRRAPVPLRLGPLVVIIDPHVLHDRTLGHAGDEIAEQAALADILVVNRTDLATADEIAATREWIAQCWPGPLQVIETQHGAVPLSVLSWPAEGGRSRVADHDHDHPPHTFGVRSFQWPSDVRLRRADLLEVAAHPAVLRSKGVLQTDEGPIELQVAGGVVHESRTGWRRDSRLDVVVRPEATAALDELARVLEGAVVDPVAAGDRIDVGGRWFDRSALAALPRGVPDVSVLVPGRAGAAARLAEVLAAAGVDPGGSVVVVARDGYTTPVTPVATLADGLLVHTLGDAPLPASHGGPFRLLVPGGPSSCANVKAVVRLSPR